MPPGSLRARGKCYGLLANREVSRAIACHGNCLRQVLGAFVTRHKRVTAVGYVFSLVLARTVGFCEVWRWRKDNVGRHFRMNIAKQRNDTGIVKLEGPFFSLWPSAEVVPQFLVTANGNPEDVVCHIVAVQEVNGPSLLHNKNVRLKYQA